MKLSPISSLNCQLALIPSFCQSPEPREPLWSLPSQMLGTQPGPCRLAPTPTRCWPSHGGQGVLAKPLVSRGGTARRNPVAHVEPCGWLHLQEDNCPARGGQPHWRLSLSSGRGAA